MQDYIAHNKTENMDIAFTSERSIEDELDRESRSDVSTILVSYVIMFAYIAISLGHIRSFSTLLVSWEPIERLIILRYGKVCPVRPV